MYKMAVDPPFLSHQLTFSVYVQQEFVPPLRKQKHHVTSCNNNLVVYIETKYIRTAASVAAIPIRQFAKITASSA